MIELKKAEILLVSGSGGCTYEGEEYSPGSKMTQEGYNVRCVADPNAPFQYRWVVLC